MEDQPERAAAGEHVTPLAGAVSDDLVPGSGRVAVAAEAPGAGEGNWVGAPSAALDADGTWVVAYRLRMVGREVAQVVVARSDEGEQLRTVGVIDRSRFGATSVERPALVRTPSGRWRLYVSLASADWPRSKHWWIEVLEADDPARLADAPSRVVFAGDVGSLAVKDPVVRRAEGGWEAWICCHPLDVRDEEDRMWTAFATSRDGLEWTWHGRALEPRPGTWDARGARVTAVLDDGRAFYDGRASKEENFSERTGRATRTADDAGRLVSAAAGPISGVRYLDVVPLPEGGFRLYYEAPLPDGSHELRTEVTGAGAPRS